MRAPLSGLSARSESLGRPGGRDRNQTGSDTGHWIQIPGTHSEYAMKKFRLLFDGERVMTLDSRVNVIVFEVLPGLRERIDERNITGMDSPMNELSLF